VTGEAKQARGIRSFVLRAGRTTAAQQRALAELWPVYGIAFEAAPLDFEAIFGRRAPVIFEIGFGNGDTLVQQALEHPDNDYIGAEVHRPGIGHCLLRIADTGVQNLRLIEHDAIEILRQQVPEHSLARIILYFPDPWPKKRHHKRRIVQHGFLDLAAERLERGGELMIATDWAGYAEHIDEVLAASDRFRVAERREHGGDAPLDRPTTKFETRGLGRGHRIWDWRLQRS
jgi:tRNA (guanine-N7-)-methyltransferase